MQFGYGAILIDELLPILDIEVNQFHRFFLLLQKILIELTVDLHVSCISVLMVQFEEQTFDQHFIREVKLVLHDDGDRCRSFDLRLLLVIQYICPHDKERVSFLILCNNSIDDCEQEGIEDIFILIVSLVIRHFKKFLAITIDILTNFFMSFGDICNKEGRLIGLKAFLHFVDEIDKIFQHIV
jgi:hypothetical protein